MVSLHLKACIFLMTKPCLPSGGLTENDFIMAAKINMVDVADLMPKKKPRFWA
jgi:hypothetical protein